MKRFLKLTATLLETFFLTNVPFLYQDYAFLGNVARGVFPRQLLWHVSS